MTYQGTWLRKRWQHAHLCETIRRVLGMLALAERRHPAGALARCPTPRIVRAKFEGDPRTSEQLLPLVYDELRQLAAQRMAREAPDRTLEPTALIHEAYLRLVTGAESQCWNSRGHFFAAAAEAMRRILVENARRKGRNKRGGGRTRVTIDHADFAQAPPRRSNSSH